MKNIIRLIKVQQSLLGLEGPLLCCRLAPILCDYSSQVLFFTAERVPIFDLPNNWWLSTTNYYPSEITAQFVTGLRSAACCSYCSARRPCGICLRRSGWNWKSILSVYFDKITKINTAYFVLTYLFSSASATKFLPLITHFGDNKITLISDRKKVSLQFSRKKGWNWCCKFLTFFYSFLVTVKSHRFSPKKRFPFNFRQNIGTYYVLQISVIPSLILVTVLSLWFSQKDGVHLHFLKWWWKKLQKLARKWILYPTSIFWSTQFFSLLNQQNV